MKSNNKNINSKIKIYILTKIFRAALFIVAPTWIQPKYTSEEWLNDPWYIYEMKLYLAIKRRKLLAYTTWMIP